MHYVIDMTDGLTAHQGSEPECMEWVNEQSMPWIYHIKSVF